MSRGNLQDYPEHLNPFKSRRSSITKSFRKVFKSFTGKDKQKPHHGDIQPHRHTIQTISTNQSPQNRTAYVPTALPRSRFKERLEKTESLKKSSREKYWLNDGYNAGNPFDDEATQQTNPAEESPPAEETPPVPAVRSKYRKRKKRTAPLPPRMTNSDGQYLDVPSRNGSKWSLTSTDTDASSICYSEYDEVERHPEKNEEILEITRKIAEFTDDSNNNLTFTSEVTINVEDVDSSNSGKKKVEGDCSKLTEEEEKVQQKEEREVEQEKNDRENSEIEEISKTEEASAHKEETTDSTVDLAHNSEAHITNGCVKSMETGCEGETIQKLDHNQNSLLRVRIIDNEEVVLRHPENYYVETTPPAEKYSIKQRIEQFESCRDSSSPASKIRQTVLTKEKLLGTEE